MTHGTIQKIVDSYFLNYQCPITKGYHNAKACIIEFIFKRCEDFLTIGELNADELYAPIELKCKLKMGTVEKRIRDFISVSWHLFPNLFEKRPSNYEFIVKLAETISLELE